MLPLLLAVGAWVLVREVLLVPREPDVNTSADECVQFIVHPRGLPRLSPEQAESLLISQLERAQRDAAFGDRFVSAMRRLPSEDRQALNTNLFRAIKPRLMRDAYAFEALDEPGRGPFLDNRIVEYAKLALLFQNLRSGRSGSGLGMSPVEAMGFVQSNTTQAEREAFMRYMGAYEAHVARVVADPERKKELEGRIGKGWGER